MKIEDIARVAHQVNKAYCESMGDNSQSDWENAPVWQIESAINGVKFHIDRLAASCSASHENWLKEKTEAGWTVGPVKDAAKKEHPCCVPYDELPMDQKVKDALFTGIARALKVLL